MTNEQLKIIIFSNKHCLKYRLKARLILTSIMIVKKIINLIIK